MAEFELHSRESLGLKKALKEVAKDFLHKDGHGHGDLAVHSGHSSHDFKVLKEVAKDFLHEEDVHGHEDLAVQSGHLSLVKEVAKDLLHEDGQGDGDLVVPSGHSSYNFFNRTRESFREKSPQIKEALHHTSSEIMKWMHKGGPWRAFLVTTVGIVVLLGLAGLGVFLFFFIVATLNAIAIGFLGSVASVGAFTAFFFTSLIAIYIGGLVVAVLTISTITFVCICAALTAAGWVAFFWLLWQGLKKGVDLCKASCFMPIGTLVALTSGGPSTYNC